MFCAAKCMQLELRMKQLLRSYRLTAAVLEKLLFQEVWPPCFCFELN